jgi:hypothetical protein
VAEGSVAIPDPLRLALPKLVVPFMNVTLPTAGPTPGAVTVTVAVRVTVCPKAAGLGDRVSAIVVLALLVVKIVAGEEVEGWNPVVPP